ncbi:MAG: hypothetical protein M3008_09375 [Chloroflexota bacterium]|nr:hypothetical protein [Chloroflexota bacterium]
MEASRTPFVRVRAEADGTLQVEVQGWQLLWAHTITIDDGVELRVGKGEDGEQVREGYAFPLLYGNGRLHLLAEPPDPVVITATMTAHVPSNAE